MDLTVRERVINYLEYRGKRARAAEIAAAIGSDSVDYTRSECNELADEDRIEKSHGTAIMGYPMPDGGWEVLPNEKDRLLKLVDEYEAYLPFNRDDVEDLTAPNLRTLLESELASGEPRPFERKVYYGPRGATA